MSVTRIPNKKRTDERELSKDTIYKTLSNNRRRLALQFIQKHSTPDTPVSLRELSEAIASEENEIAVTELTYKQRKRVHTSLYQSHLPALHKEGIVNYDTRAGTVTPTPVTQEFIRHLDGNGAELSRWRRYWVGLGVGAVALTGGAWLGLLPVDVDVLPAVGFVVSVIVFLSALIFAAEKRL